MTIILLIISFTGFSVAAVNWRNSAMHNRILNQSLDEAEALINSMTVDVNGVRAGDALAWRESAWEAQDIAAQRGRELAVLQSLITSHFETCDNPIDSAALETAVAHFGD